MHHRLEDAAREWDAGARDPSDLLRGSRLSLTEEWAADHEDDLSEREHDYLTASQVAAASELTEARAQADRERRTSFRLRRLLVGTAALLVLALVAGAVAVQQRGVADDQRSIARAEARVADARVLASAAVANLDVDPERSGLLALEAHALLGSGESKADQDVQEALHQAAVAMRIEQRLPDVGGAVGWSGDGQLLAVQGPVGSGVVEVYDATTWERRSQLQAHDADITAVALNFDGSLLGTTGWDGVAKVWDPQTGEAAPRPRRGGYSASASFSPDGRLFAAAWPDDGGGLVQVLDLRSGEIVHEIRGVPTARRLSFNPDGTQLAASGRTTVGSVIDLTTGAVVLTLRGHSGQVMDIDWSPNGEWIATAGGDGSARVFDAESGAQQVVATGHTSGVVGVDWDPTSARLATASDDGTAKLWAIGGGGAYLLSTLSAHDTTSGVVGGLLAGGEPARDRRAR